MNISITEESKQRMIVEVEGESHGFCNVLKDEIWKNKKTTSTGYNISHPLTSSPKIIIEGPKPKDILSKACKSLNKECEEFKKVFKKKAK